MRLIIAALLLLVLAPSAQACVKLPARSATNVPISGTKHTAVRVCGHVFARAGSGTRIGEASAAGHRVAWIEEHRQGRVLTAIVTLADARRGILRRFVVRRERTLQRAEIHVLLTRRGDLAWSAGTTAGRGVVAVDQPGKATRRLDRWAADGLALTDRERTLAWGEELGFFDLRRRGACPRREGFKPVARTDRVIVSRWSYDAPFMSNAVTVFRGCDLATGRDRVLLIAPEENIEYTAVAGRWVLFTEWSESSLGLSNVGNTVVDVAGGKATYCDYADPGGAFVVTRRGWVAWLADATLHACRRGKSTVLDRDATLANLRAEGDVLHWTHDGAPRSFTTA